MNARQARQRYLDGLREANDDEDEERACVLCKCEFEKGLMLGCTSHRFMKVDITDTLPPNRHSSFLRGNLFLTSFATSDGL